MRLPKTASLLLAAFGPVFGEASWRSLAIPPDPDPIRCLAARGDTLWAGMDDGVRRTVDGGLSWSEPGTGMEAGPVAGILRAGDRLLACQKHQIYASADGGRTWSSNDTLVGMNYIRMDTHGDTLFAVYTIFFGTFPDGSRFSTDGGHSWSDPVLGLLPPPSPRAFKGELFFHAYLGNTLFRDSSGESVTVLSVPDAIVQIEATTRGLYMLTQSGICMSSQGGRGPWDFLAATTHTGAVHAVAADREYLAIQTGRGISLSRDRGKNWQPLQPTAFPADRQKLAMGSGVLYAWTTETPLIRRYDLATSKWETLASPDGTPVRAMAAQSDLLLVAGPTGGTGAMGNYLSTDRGNHFGPARAAGLPGPPGPPPFGNPVSMAWKRDSLFASTLLGIFATADSGRSWKQWPTSCNEFALAASDSGLFGLAGTGSAGPALFRPTRERYCSAPMPLPYDNPDTPAFLSLAGSGGDLYLGTQAGLWVWSEAPASTALGPKARPRGAHTARSRPVKVWAGPDPDALFDAKGARNR